ncbi:GTPase regulator, putative [Eimeria acervulina]|uniref:GTPase regulator, putative n=1 Tax=Eimeria acervulina TaxID=5801 RepID=U6GAR0_EIMAC|nr:GTPase regulator, putative [Eimeria acervulina]CDI76592.1 GTPase regulator, putative [Eimeria acervulina]
MLRCSTGDTLTGLRVLQVDAARGRLQLTTRPEAEVQRLQQWKEQALRIGGQKIREETPEEKFAKIAAALKLLERHRKKKQAGGGAASTAAAAAAAAAAAGGAAAGSVSVSVAPPQRSVSSETLTQKQLEVLFPGYSAADVDEALSLLETERRHRELLRMQEEERKARKRHPRFLRQSADDLSIEDAKQLLKKESGLVTIDMLQQDAAKYAERAGLAAADVPVLGADGIPVLQQIPIKDIQTRTQTHAIRSHAAATDTASAAAAAAAAASPAAAGKNAAATETAAGETAAADGEVLETAAGETAAAEGEQIEREAAETAAAAAEREAAEGLEEEVEVSLETLQRELKAYDTPQQQQQQQPRDRKENLSPYKDRKKDRKGDINPLGCLDTSEEETAEQVTAAELAAFFSKSEADLLQSLKKERSRDKKGDSAAAAAAAAHREEIRQLIKGEHEAAMHALLSRNEGAPKETPKETPEETPEEAAKEAAKETEESIGGEGGDEETLGDVQHSEVLQTIRDRLQGDPELRRELRLRGETPESIATQIQQILFDVTGLASMLQQQQPRASKPSAVSGPRRRLGQGDRSLRARIPKTPPAAAAAAAPSGGPRAAEDEEEEGFSSCLFQLSGEEVSPLLREASSERRQKKGDSGMQQADNLSFIQRQRTRRNSPMSRRRQKRQ